MPRFKKLKSLLQPKKEEKEIKLESAGELDESLEKIVARMKEKYMKEGLITTEEARKGVREKLFGRRKIEIEASPRELLLYDNALIRAFGKLYLTLESPMSKFIEFFKKRQRESLKYDLLASGFNYSVDQYLAIVFSATMITWVISTLLILLLMLAGGLNPAIAVIMIALIPMITIFIGLTIPRSKANKLANQIEKELPFALRHMSIEIRAGVGIYKTMESIASSGYGPLSIGFKWVLSQIEKGEPTEDVLEEWAQRTRSDAVKRVVSHMVRALRTGGNLSEIMVTIAEDVSFERRAKIADFAEKLNLLGLFLMMAIIVLPVMITILTTIASAPSIAQYLKMFSFFSKDFLIFIYFIISPALMFIFMYFIKTSDPG